MGCPRSGTSLVGRLLDSHSRMAVYHETHYYPVFRRQLHRYGDLCRGANLRRLIADFLEHIRMQGVGVVPSIDELHSNLVAPTFGGVLATFLHMNALREGKTRSGEKTPGHYAFLPELQETFPESPVIFVIRDPRDTVRSIRKNWSTSIEGAAFQWNEAWRRHREAKRPVHLIKYESLVEDSEAVLEETCAFLGDSFEPGMMRFFERIPEHILSLKHLDLGPLTSPLNTASVGRFRDLPEREIGQIEGLCAAGMEALGYSFVTSFRAPTIRGPRRLRRRTLLFDKLRYYRFNRERWRRGWYRWKMSLRLLARYWVRLGPLTTRR